MARGQTAKSEIQNKILSTFEGSFLYNDGKEIRIPIMEAGELVQIKVSLTCAKENVNVGDDNAIPGDFPAAINKPVTPVSNEPITPTADEKKKVQDLFSLLGL